MTGSNLPWPGPGQVREREGTDIFEAPLQECLVECATESCHESAVFLLDEAILSEAPHARQLDLPTEEWGENWFDYFPPALQPSDCLLIGGRGARWEPRLHALLVWAAPSRELGGSMVR